MEKSLATAWLLICQNGRKSSRTREAISREEERNPCTFQLKCTGIFYIHGNIGKDEVGGSNPPSSSRKHLKSSDFRCFFADSYFLYGYLTPYPT